MLRKVADDLAPVHNIRRRRGRLAPWFDTECRSLRQECRRLERCYRRTYTAEHCRSWVDATRRRHQVYRSNREQNWLERVQSSEGSSFQLWRSLSTLLGRDRDIAGVVGHSADEFGKFFARKIEDIRASTAGVPPAPITNRASSTVPSFRPCTTTEVRRIIMSPVKSCSLDAVPTFRVREFVDVLLPYLTAMVNASLAQGRLPVSQQHAIVTPLLRRQDSTPPTCLIFVPSPTSLLCPRLLSGQSSVSSRSTCLPTTSYRASSQLTGRVIRLKQRCYEYGPTY